MALFDDDELEEFYRRVELSTAAASSRPRRRRRPVTTAAIVCPTPEKIAYPDYAAVTGAILAITRASRTRPSLRCYECRCGYWHLTSGVPRPE
ncbi:hypothetical protein L5G32_06385 [Gordonia sp. HY002]|uniref:hypothetical protein n=1 Tax=Gordonia zhenghanii TaxID=2911516 RepID=UPI001EEFA3CF|nr:hypothetical protein [Gordonia zhenghanii]MCF8569891.1 hypothetical protein [Gordonia zhenghanii]MCF8602425.1 hypothetical protein [Gordonia zhenghanii]